MTRGVAFRGTAVGFLALTLAASVHRPGLASELPSIAGLLDRYRAGGFDAAVQQLSPVEDSESVRSAFIQGADAWIASQPSDAANRRLAATAFAVELVQARRAHDSDSLFVLLDWAAKEWRKGSPSPAEHMWMLAAVALAERGGHGRISGKSFIDAAAKRFPQEPRFTLAKAVFFPNGQRRGDFQELSRNAIVGADALVQLAFLEIRERDYQEAIQFARRAVDRAVEPATQYLAHFILGFCHEVQRRPADAAAEYAAALRAVADGQSASVALALLLLRDNQANAAFDLIDRSLATHPDGDDPWRLFYYGGYVRWPTLIADLRAMIR